MQGTLHSASNITKSGKENFDDEESIVSTRSEKLEPVILEEGDDVLTEF